MVGYCRKSGAAILAVFSYRRDACATSRRRYGFTLLEVLLAMLLMATLLLTLWSLIGTYTSLFAAGQARIERSQIARSLLQQMCDDFHSAIEDTAARPRLGNSADTDTGSSSSVEGGQVGNPSAVRRFGLFGSPRELRVDVVQAVPAEDGIAAARWDDEQQAAAGNQFDIPTEAGRRAPELRTVYYTFNRPQESDEVELPPRDEGDGEQAEEMPPGLVREEIDFETNSDEAESEAESRFDDASVLLAPEVADLEFRYFDGAVWATSWDSIARKSLPVAVEIRLKIESRDPPADTESQEDAAADEMPADCESYRLVVELPTARLHHDAGKTPRRADVTLQQPPSPLSAKRLEKMILSTPRISPSNKSQSNKQDEQRWLRVDP